MLHTSDHRWESHFGKERAHYYSHDLFLSFAIFRQASPVLMLEHFIFRVFELKSVDHYIDSFVDKPMSHCLHKFWRIFPPCFNLKTFMNYKKRRIGRYLRWYVWLQEHPKSRDQKTIEDCCSVRSAQTGE